MKGKKVASVYVLLKNEITLVIIVFIEVYIYITRQHTNSPTETIKIT